MDFPNVSGSNLLREQIELPKDLEGELNLLFIPFQQWQQSVVDSWVPFVQELEAKYPEMKYYELPTIREMNWFAKTFINEGMRAGIPNSKTRERTITLYLDKKSFRRMLEIHNEEDVTILLIDPDGAILWRSLGHYSPEKGMELENFIQEYISRENRIYENENQSK